MARTGRAPGALFVDTNIFVRLLTNDPPGQARQAERALDAAASGRFSAILSDVIVAELAYVLTEVYGLDRPLASDRLTGLVGLPGVEAADASLLVDAASIWSGHRLDFADAYLAALARSTRGTGVLSFDRDFDRVEGIRRVDPSSFGRR